MLKIKDIELTKQVRQLHQQLQHSILELHSLMGINASTIPDTDSKAIKYYNPNRLEGNFVDTTYKPNIESNEE